MSKLSDDECLEKTYNWHHGLLLPEAMSNFYSHAADYVLRKIGKKVVEDLTKIFNLPRESEFHWDTRILIIQNYNKLNSDNIFIGHTEKLKTSAAGATHIFSKEKAPSFYPEREKTIEVLKSINGYVPHPNSLNNKNVHIEYLGNAIIQILKNTKTKDVLDDDYEIIKNINSESQIWEKSCLYFINDFLSDLWFFYHDEGFEISEYYLIFGERGILTHQKDHPNYGLGDEWDHDAFSEEYEK